jgi:phosphatidylserine/phosphatidylglycerophosphate/cardiolipin synthase-like enzyme
LIRDVAIFDKILEGLRTAKDSASLQVYEWHADSGFSKKIVETLKQRSLKSGGEKPFVFRALLNEKNPLLSYFETPRQPMRPRADLERSLSAAGIDSSRVKVEVGAHRHLDRAAFHSKSARFGDWGMVQGQNVEDVHRYDIAYVLRGEVLDAIDADTTEAWNEVVKPELREKQLSPKATPVNGADLPILVATKNESGRSTGTDNPLSTVLLTALRQLGQGDEVKLITPNLSDPEFLEEVFQAMRRGAVFHMVLPYDFNERKNNLPGAGGGNRKHVQALKEKLAKYNVPLKRFDLRWYSEDRKTIHQGQAGGTHAKAWWIFSPKGCLSFVGSSNKDVQSFDYSRELDLVVDSRKVAEAWSGSVFDPVFDRSIPAFA